MYLVMTEEKPSPHLKLNITSLLKGQLATESYYGESTGTIKGNLEREPGDAVIVSADSRLLNFVHTHFDLSQVYIYRNGNLFQLTDTDHRTLRQGHNLMKLYEAGAFTAPAGSV